MFATPLFALLTVYVATTLSNPLNHASQKDNMDSKSLLPASSCFPALDFHKPLSLPKDNLQWWCDPSTEYAFLGFSYEVTACEFTCLHLSSGNSTIPVGQSREQLHKEFKDIRNHFKSRYVRLYGACDREGF